jgi:hypothetical protein
MGEGGEVDTKSSLLGAAVAASRGERGPDELIEDEEGPVQRTQRRRVHPLAARCQYPDRQAHDSHLHDISVVNPIGSE